MAGGKTNIGNIFGDKTLSNLIQKTDTFIDALPKPKDSTIKHGYSNVINNVVGSVGDIDLEDSQIHQILNNLSVPFERQNRYKVYDDIYSSVPLIKAIIRVYKNNILQKDAIESDVITLLNSKDNQHIETIDRDKIKEFCENIIRKYSLEDNLSDKILPNLLKYGEIFLEIIDLKNDISNLPDKTSQLHTNPNLVYEAVEDVTSKLSQIDNNKNGNKYNELSRMTIYENCLNKLINSMVEIDTVKATDEDVILTEYDLNKDGKPDNISILNDDTIFNRVLIRYHQPKNVIVLETYYGTVIGFVEIKETRGMEVTGGIGIRFAQLLSQIGAGIKTSSKSDDQVSRQIVNSIISKVIQQTDIVKIKAPGKTNKEVNKEFEETLRVKLGDELFYHVKRLFVEANPENLNQQSLTKLKIRFIPADRMVWKPYNVNEYRPYGTSIIDSLVYPAKLYLLTQMANVVTKLSRAAVMRKWTLETGPREQSSGQIQKLKRELRQQRITAENLLSFKSIPRIMSD
jgi:phosphotransferase system HPr-like phosphotransfer protein